MSVFLIGLQIVRIFSLQKRVHFFRRLIHVSVHYTDKESGLLQPEYNERSLSFSYRVLFLASDRADHKTGSKQEEVSMRFSTFSLILGIFTESI